MIGSNEASKALASFEETRRENERPISPKSKNAQEFFDSIHGKGFGNKQEVIDLILENRKNNKEFQEKYQQIQLGVMKTVHDTKEELKLRAQIRAERLERDQKQNQGVNLQNLIKEQRESGPHNVTALPPIKKRFRPFKPIQGISYLSNTGFYEEILTRQQAR